MTTTLAIATSTPQVTVALSNDGGVVASFALRAGRRHGETLAPAIHSLTALAGIGLAELDRIAVDTGPGLFTGLRVGVSTAKALGAALDRPVVGVSSLDILAHPLRHLGREVAAVVDARRGEVFWARYEPVGDAMAAVTEAAVAAPDELAGLGPDVVLVGDGARRYLDVWSSPVAPPEFDHPSAAVLAVLAAGRPDLPPEKITPTYLRGADVRIGWEQR